MFSCQQNQNQIVQILNKITQTRILKPITTLLFMAKYTQKRR
jgi:hypothetical protein